MSQYYRSKESCTEFIGKERFYLTAHPEGPQPVDFGGFHRFANWYKQLPLEEIIDTYSVDSPHLYLFSSNFLRKEEATLPDVNVIYLDCTTAEIKEVNPLSIELEPARDDPQAKYIQSIEFRDFDYCVVEPYYLQTERTTGIDEIKVHADKTYSANNIIVLLRGKE